MSYDEIKPILDELKKRTSQEAFSLNINESRVPKITDSKFGGVPYWDMKKSYPKDLEGKPLMLLAQINFDGDDFGSLLPKKGMLQFFIGRDDLYGADFDNPDIQNSFRVVYHESIDYEVAEEDVLSLGITTSLEEENEEFTPVYGTYALDIEKKMVSIGEVDYRFYSLVNEIAKEKGIPLKESSLLYEFLDDTEYDELYEELSNTGHWMLGYPYFTQYDPREIGKDSGYYDTLLFQMDSDYSKDRNDLVLWGDCGVGNFFINKEDLKDCKFDKVLYNWDCS